VPRIAGVDIPDDKPIWISMTYIHGVGVTTSRKVLEEARIEPHKRARELSGEDIGRIVSILDRGFEIEGQLRRRVAQDILRLKKIGCYRGTRHIRGLPVRGQRTKTNARTRKGKRKTVAGKRSVKEMR
jgi:small subunit ribosomal protein S13